MREDGRTTLSRLALCLAGIALAGLLGGCSEEGLTAGATRQSLNLLLQADVGNGAPGREVEVSAFYTHTDQGRVVLSAAQRFPVDVGTTPLPALSIDIAKCLGDADREGGKGCPLSVLLKLLDPGDGAVDSVVVGPVDVTGQASDSVLSLPPVVLRRAYALELPDSIRVHAGDTITPLAHVLDRDGRPIAGRTIKWSSVDGAVATATPSGVVTGVAVGRGSLTAAREGLSATVPVSVPITGVTRWVAGPRLGSIGDGALIGFVYGITATVDGTPMAFPWFRSCLRQAAWACSNASFRAMTVVSWNEVWGAGSHGRVGRFNGTNFSELGTGPANAWTATGSGSSAFAAVADTLWSFDGTRWTGTTFGSGPKAAYRSLWAVSDRNVFAVGDSNVVARFDGTSWTRSALPSNIPWAILLSAWAFDANNVFVAGQAGFAWRFDGTQWHPMPAPVWDIVGLHGTSPTDLYAAAAVDSQSVLIRWDGTSWSKLANFPYQIHRVRAVGNGRVLVAGEQGYVAEYQSGTVTALSASPDLTEPTVAAANDAAAAGGNEVWRFDGMAWNTITPPWRPPYFGYMRSTWSSGPNDLFVQAHVRPCDVVLHFNGASWRRLAGCDAAYGQIVGLGPGDVLVIRNRWDGAKWNPSILRCSSTACQTHVPEHGGPWEWYTTLWASSPTNVFALGTGPDTLFRYGHRFNGLSLATRNLSGYPTVVWGIDSSSVLASTYAGLFRYNYATAAWDPVPRQPGGFSAVWGTANDDVYGAGCSVQRYNGRWWRAMPLPGGCIRYLRGLPGGGAIATGDGSLVSYGVGPNGTLQGSPGMSAVGLTGRRAGGSAPIDEFWHPGGPPPGFDAAGRLLRWPSLSGRLRAGPLNR